MYNKEQILKKMCSFYVSDIHLSTMLLPYVTKNLEEGKKIQTFLEKDIRKDIEILLSSLNFSDSINKEIRNIKWNKSNVYKYLEIEKCMNENIKKNKELYIIIIGKEDYIDIINSNIKKWIDKNINKIEKMNIHINIIDCYEIVQINNNINEILDKHDKILNTSGEKEINEIFEGYKKGNKKIAE